MSAIEKAVKLLRREAESMKECHTVGVGGEWYGESAKGEYDEMIAAADAAIAERDELRAKIEAAEKERGWHAARCEDAMNECDALRSKITEMERQEPVGKFIRHPSNWLWEQDGYGDNPDARPLYALPGAQAQPAQKAVAYLDLGVGGYVDVGTDLTDEALAAIPKGRHMLGIVGTYGVDGYVPAQPAPSVPTASQQPNATPARRLSSATPRHAGRTPSCTTS